MAGKPMQMDTCGPIRQEARDGLGSALTPLLGTLRTLIADARSRALRAVTSAISDIANRPLMKMSNSRSAASMAGGRQHRDA